MRLQNEVHPEVFNPLAAYDGKANLFATKKYDFPQQSFDVPWSGDFSVHKGGGGGRQPRMVKIEIKWVKAIDKQVISRLLKGWTDTVQKGSDAMMTLNMLNVFVQASPKMLPNSLYNTKSFFLSGVKAAPHTINPLEIWRGYYQTVRPTYDRLIINVDLTVGIIIPSRSLNDIFSSYLRQRDTRGLLGLKKDSPNVRTLKTFSKGLKFTIDLPGHKDKKPKSINDIIVDAGEVTFDKGGEEVTVANHFYNMYGVTVPPRSLGVRTKRGDVFPIGVCRSVQQLYKGRNSPAVVQEAMKFMPQNPRDRLSSVLDSWQCLQYDNSPFMSDAGLKVNPRPVVVTGRLLPPPKVSFDNSPGQPHKQPGVWDVMRKRFFKPASIRSWTVVSFAPDVNRGTLERFLSGLVNEMQGHGMKAGPPHNISIRNGQSDVMRALNEEGAEAKADMILVVLPESAEELRNAVKRFGDVIQGVATQCVKWTDRREQETRNGKINQYQNNLILKINTRLGGINFRPGRQWFQNQPTMVLGADVSHPGPGSQQPSVAALVGSVDPWYTRYVAATRVQDPRVEMMEDLEGMFEQVLSKFHEMNKVLPLQIVFYRDGVSEGEFMTVRDAEISKISGALHPLLPFFPHHPPSPLSPSHPHV
ncbi:hypothetical protein AX17_007156 [Amanita inopinata Kibby_2008]|nr:hypothetical protein AX17_007156 [Amanita inopinata Kibby_2008]